MIPSGQPWRGRLAPSPTGALHVGNVRTFLVAWLAARVQGGSLVLRVEDLEKPASGIVLEEMLSDLAWLGLEWDEGPNWTNSDEAALDEFRRYPKTRPAAAQRKLELIAPHSSPDWVSDLGRLIQATGEHAPYIQSQRGQLYEAVFENLLSQNLIYPCVCSRADYAAQAPHAGDSDACYPGTCRDRFADYDAAAAWLARQAASADISDLSAPRLAEPVWRFRSPGGPVEFHDQVFGRQVFDVGESAGDFVVFKNPRQPSYQMAVAIDDSAMAITQVVRGADLLASTARQILLYQALNRAIPQWVHVPLILGPDGKRIAKRHGDSRIRHLRESGVDPRHIIGVLAGWLGMGTGEPREPAELLDQFSLLRLPTESFTLNSDALLVLENGPKIN